MSMRVKAALVIVAIVFVFTAASFFLSFSFTQSHMTETLEQQLTQQQDIPATVTATINGVQQGLLYSALFLLLAGVIVSIFISRVAIHPFQTIETQASHIREENERITLLFDTMPLSCCLLDRTSNVFRCNEGTFRLFELTDRDEFINHFYEYSPTYQPDGQLSVMAANDYVSKAFSEGVCSFEWMHQKKDGTPLPTEVTLIRIVYDGDTVVAAYARDQREQKRMMQDIKRRDELLSTVNHVAAALLQSDPDTFSSDITRCMGMMASTVSVDRVYIWKNHTVNGKLYCTQLYEWSGGAEPQQDSDLTINVSYDEIAPEWEETLSKGDYICGFVREMPTEIKAQLSAQDILSIFVMPLFVRDDFWGFVGFDDCHNERIFTENEKSILQSGCILMANALLRNAQVIKVREAHDRAMVVLSKMPYACHLWNKDLEIFDCNDENIRLFNAADNNDFMRNFLKFIPEYQPDGQRSIEIAHAELRKAFTEGKRVYNEFIYLTSGGVRIPVEVTLVRIPYDDEYVVAAYLRDLREHKQMIEEIERNNRLLNTANQAANILLQSESDVFEEDLYKCMSMIGNAVKADRVCIWKNKTIGGNLYCDLIYDWPGGEGSLVNSEKAVNVSYSDNTPGWEEILSRGDYINTMISLVSPEEKMQLEAHGVKSLFVSPVFIRGEFWGYVGFDDYKNEKVYAKEEASTLHSGSLLIANALVRNEMMLSIQDATKQLEVALNDAKRASEAKSRFLANMSHEMRTPLNAIIGLTDLTLGNDRLDEENYLNIEKINNAGMVLLSTVNDILDISKIEAGKFELVPVTYDMPSLINDTIIQSITHREEKPILFTLDIDGNLPAMLFGDELRIKQILNNLLSNAFKYTRSGTVEFGIRCERILNTNADQTGTPADTNSSFLLRIYVKDTGIGISPEYLDNIFDDYSQMDTQANRKIMGTGLGLSITKRMINIMNGTISVESVYGEGSLFSVTIPQGFVNDSVIGAEMAENLRSFKYYEQKRRQNSKLPRISLPYARVLVVDDVPTNLDVARGLMKPYAMKVDCVASGQEAIDAIRSENVHYNAVFMDHMMPGMDGIEATSHIRELGTKYAEKIPIIALTANAITGNEEMFLEKGFQAFISKPIELPRLDAVIRRWIRDKEQEKLYIDRQINIDGNPVIDTRSGRDRRADTDRRAGLSHRSFGELSNKLDIRKGIERFAGNEELYLGILRSFSENTGPLLEKVKNVNAGNLADYAVTIHGLKGAIRAIFAETAGNMADALEKAAKASDFLFISMNNQDFIDTVDELIVYLETILRKIDDENPKPVKDTPDKETLAKLLAACGNYDMDGADAVMAELEQFEYQSGNDLISCLRGYLDEADFAHIIGTLSDPHYKENG